MNKPTKRRPGARSTAVWFCCAVLLAQFGGRAQAADPDPSVPAEAVVVTASRLAQSVSDALPSTTLITREEIEQSQELDLVSLLRRVAGVEIGQSGALGAQASIFMRGANSNQTLVLVDGVRMNAVESGGALIEHLMASDIDHIEIVRGNVSALYGSQAVGGVIQIFTRAGSMDPGTSVNFAAGTARSLDASLATAQVWGGDGERTRAALNVSGDAQKGWSTLDTQLVPDANPDKDGYRNGSLSAALSQQIGRADIGLDVFESRGRLEFGDPSDYSYLDPNYNGRTETNLEQTQIENASLHASVALGQSWTSKLTVSSQHDFSQDSSSFVLSPVIGTTDSRTTQYDWENTVRIDAGQRILVSIGNVVESGVSSAYVQTFSRTVDSALLGYVGNFGNNELQADLRRDHYSDFGNADSGLLAYGYRLGGGWKAIAELSTAFDAPSFDDLYYPYFSNPALQPEKSRSAELGIQYDAKSLHTRVDAYRTDVRDLIEFNSSFIPENVAQAKLEGIEASFSGGWQKYTAYANLTLQDPINETTGQALERRSHHSFNFGIARDDGPWRMALDVISDGPRPDSDINTGMPIELAGYAVTNLLVRYAIDPRTTTSVSLMNAFDRRYFLVDGYNTAGRVLMFGVSFKL